MFNPYMSESNTQFPGLYVGKVHAIAGDPLLQPPPPDAVQPGWVKVTVPAIFDKETPEYAVWARPCFPYGHFFVPEKKDKVWVAFENGDPRSPVWLGIWYPKGKVPSEAQGKPLKKRVIQSSKGHVITLNDDDIDSKITIQHESGQGKIEWSKNGLLLSFGDSSISLNAQGITLEGLGSSISLSATGIKLNGLRIDLN